MVCFVIRYRCCVHFKMFSIIDKKIYRHVYSVFGPLVLEYTSLPLVTENIHKQI